jgi:hypothetical protein
MDYVLDNPPLGQARNKPMKLPSEAEAFSPFQPLKNCNCPKEAITYAPPVQALA